MTAASAKALRRAWFFPTGDSVTATPTVVHGIVYVGSWDDRFYALDLATGKPRWTFRLHSQNGVTPYPGQKPRDVTSDGGLVTSSAWFEPGVGNRPDLVVFGGGYTLYALDARTGHLFWSHEYTDKPGKPADPNKDDARIFSSPVVVDGRVVVGLSTDGGDHRRGYVLAASIDTGKPVWIHETDVDANGKIQNDGCGNVWSSATVLPAEKLLVLDTADCHFQNPPPLNESVIALRVSDGSLAWHYRPSREDTSCDLDFGASVNAGLDAKGRADFLGVGAKDGTYYSIDPATGRLRWKTNVVFGGFAGGFIATAAYDGKRVYGSTSIGDFGRFEGNGEVHCDPNNPRDTPSQEPSAHVLDAATGNVIYEARKSASFAPTTIAGDLTFNGVGLTSVVRIRDAATGAVVIDLKLDAACWSGIATIGDAVVFGTGSSQQGSPAGISVYTPGGRPPVVPTA